MNDLDFYELEARDEQLRFLLQYAMLAPSRHDADLPRFRVVPDGIEVAGDALLSVGAAIANLRVAAAHFGFESTVLYSDPIVVALRETCATDENLRTLFPAILKRHSNHKPFCYDPLPPETVGHLCDLVERYPEHLSLLPHRRLNDRALSHHDRVLIESAPALVVLRTEADRISLVKGGEVLELLLLRITLDGLEYSLFETAGGLLIRIGRLTAPAAEKAHVPEPVESVAS